MKLQAITHEELFSLGVAIVRSVTGVQYPFTERTFHRALVQVQAMFGANANIEMLRLIKGGSLEGLRGMLLDRRALENSVTRWPATAARVAGRFVRSGATGVAVPIPPNTVVIRPATATQSEVAFRSEAAATIQSADTESNLVFLTATETGIKGNVIPSGAQLQLRNPVNKVDHFLCDRDSGGGFSRESDDALRTRARVNRKASGECTWTGIETLLGTVEISTGQRILSAKVFEAFDETSPMGMGIIYAIIDDGTGDPNTIGPIDATTYGYGGATWWEFESSGYNVYIDVPDYPFEIWADGVNATLERDNGGGWTAQTENTDYWVNSDTGIIALNSPLTTGQKIRIQFSFYTALIKEAAKFVNGIRQSSSIRGWRPVGFPVRIRAPYAVDEPSVSATMIFEEGWDSTFGRTLAATNILAYLDGLPIGDSARYDVVGGIIHKTPGVKYIEDLLLDGATVDFPPTHKYGVVRGDPNLINL